MITIKFKKHDNNIGKFSLELLFDGVRKGSLFDLNDKDLKQFKSWVLEYNNLLNTLNNRNNMLNLGYRIYLWLNKKENLMEKILSETSIPPLFIEFTVSKKPKAQDLAFLEVPWELLAIEKQITIDKNKPFEKFKLFLAQNENYQYCPIRRIGNKKQSIAPSKYRLSTVFMAASPIDAALLNYEAEEIAIIDATGKKGIDLTVEESGNLSLLSQCIAEQEHVDVLHISCHGTNKSKPVLILETDQGQTHQVNPLEFSMEINNSIKLLFLSACLTSSPNEFFASYSSAMIKQGFSSVLGWAGSVKDNEATVFASYRSA